MCSLDPGTCSLCVFDATSGICYLGQVGASTAGVIVNTALSSTVYTRMRKTLKTTLALYKLILILKSLIWQ